MLKHLIIKNYALIESLDIDFQSGFSVITGQTGAGKSILLGAIGLLTGDRADLGAIQQGAQRCTIEAEFDIAGYNLERLFADADLDYDPQCCTIRRELTTTGKSRAFINDTPTTLAVLRTLGDRLMDIHSQHQNLLLSTTNFQLSVLDTLADDATLLSDYHKAFNAWQHAVKALRQAEDASRQGHDEEDYLRYQVKQLDDFQPKDGEDELLEAECNQMEHAQDITQALSTGAEILSGEDDRNVLSALHQTIQQLQGISGVYADADGLLERLDSCSIELKDIAETLSCEAERIDLDPQRLAEIQDRLNTLYSLEQKHHVSTSGELYALWQQMQQQLSLIDNSDERLAELQAELDVSRQALDSLAAKLTMVRHKASLRVEKTMVASLKQLGMPNVQFKVDIRPLGAPMLNGMDNVDFLFAANKNQTPVRISQIASGGEIARVMLSLKALLSKSTNLPTIIFDEIDTGVSGQIAQSMARIMLDMGNDGRQVISITHLPQIAAMGLHHYRVWKEDTDDATLSHITQLTADERVTEIAHMLSGDQLGDAAISNAKELLKSN